MPTYTYQCNECSEIFDEFHLMSETVDSCKKCGSSSVKRIISKPSVNNRVSINTNKKAGSVVKEYIKDVKEEIRQEKKKLSTKEY
jgi:putative FmdB family regulatory protein